MQSSNFVEQRKRREKYKKPFHLRIAEANKPRQKCFNMPWQFVKSNRKSKLIKYK